MTLDATATVWLVLSAYAAAVVSALLPWVNGELLSLAAVPSLRRAVRCWRWSWPSRWDR